MIAKLFFVWLLVAGTCVSPLTSTVNYSDAFNKFLQAFIKMAPLGCPAENIPILDPITNQFATFNYTRGETSIVGNASNIRISGLSNIVVLNDEFDPVTNHVKFDILFPEIQILGSTIMEGVFNVLGFTFPTRQNTLLNERLEQLRFIGEYTFAESLINLNGLRITALKLQFYVGEVRMDNWDKLWSISGNSFYDRWSRDTIAFMSQYIQPSMDVLLQQYVLPPINNLLSTLSMTKLTNSFANTADIWDGDNCYTNT